MSSVLSQNEVDALLQGISGGEFDVGDDESQDYGEEEVIPYDLTSQDRIIRGRMPTLEIIHDRFVRMFRLTLSSALRKVVDISVRSTELIKFGEFLKTLPVPSSLNLFRMSPLRGNAIMVLETRLVFTLIDLFFGGTGELEVKAEGRDFS
ncbi:MAG: flagellar motor switch protein FliM, partial [SAR324 cluster bacterium]|nr:flagellar motor switch protein FliM [SAR324 cluster bacterium]